jgi:diphthamide synthase (EF-2-diphthine--ammonia ligase)
MNRNLIKTIPSSADVCGENGEFHTFVYDGPIFKSSIKFKKALVVEKSYQYKFRTADGTVRESKASFWFQDLQSV